MRVIKEFKCLMSGRIYFPGTDYPEDDLDRVAYLCERGFLGGPAPDCGNGQPIEYDLPGCSDGGDGNGRDATGGKTGTTRQKRGV